MISLYDHIIELRAELRSCYISSPQERAEITAELDQANSAGGQPRRRMRAAVYLRA